MEHHLLAALAKPKRQFPLKARISPIHVSILAGAGALRPRQAQLSVGEDKSTAALNLVDFPGCVLCSLLTRAFLQLDTFSCFFLARSSFVLKRGLYRYVPLSLTR